MDGYLARCNAGKAIVFSSELLNAVEAVAKGDTTHLQAVTQWFKALKGNNITRLQRLLLMRCTSQHFTVVDLRKNVSTKKFASRIADSSCKNVDHEQELLAALNTIIAELFPGFGVQPGLSHSGALQNNKNNCAFHAILSQASFLTGKMTSAVDETCRQDAARLRAYTVLLVHADMRQQRHQSAEYADLPELADLYRQWQAGRLDSRALAGSALTASAADAPGTEGLHSPSAVECRSADMDLYSLVIVHKQYV
jgi:hypothetical protein